MGKLLETLQQASGCRLPGSAEETLPPPGEVVAVLDAVPEDEVPFIEVGGRRTPLEASPSVLASAPPVRESPRPPALPAAGPRLQNLDPPVANVMSVHFRPLGSGP